MTESRYIVGIDLGTTHTVVSFVDTAQATNDEAFGEGVQPEIFPVDQLVAPGEVAAKPMLPSFRYHSLSDELPPTSMQLPWPKADLAGEISHVIIGSWARQLGAGMAGRLVASAKSWLSHSQVDRHAAILPWDGDPEVSKVSPVLASASYLNHVRSAWNYHHPDEFLEHQQLVITVPASFDESARALTVNAAQLVGLQNFVLLEEPQAVVYDWYARHRTQATELLKGVNLLLVCDVGGGTTDLSLIQVKNNRRVQDISKTGELSLNRIGVGDHLMLGGDNIDLALAHRAEIALGMGGKNLSTARLAQLIQQCRQAKETLLAEDAPDFATVTLMGSGAKLIGGAKKCALAREEVHSLVLDGFFPVTAFNDKPSKRSAAIIEFGLPYVSDPAVSKHIAEFLEKHQQAAAACSGLDASKYSGNTAAKQNDESPVKTILPEAILFNGGVFNSPMITSRVTEVVNHWRCEGSQPLTVLANTHADLAVAYGAAAYGVARRYKQLKIGGGSARSFFLVLDDDPQSRRGVCILPKGTEENRELLLAEHRFELKLEQPVKFNLAVTNSDQAFQPGEICQLKDDFVMLPPLLVALDSRSNNKKAAETDGNSLASKVVVNLIATLTEVGTIELSCQAVGSTDGSSGVDANSKTSGGRWKLEFEIRKASPGDKIGNSELPAQFSKALDKIDEVYGPKRKEVSSQAIKTLRNELIKLLGKREDWSTHVLRALASALLERKKNRNRSEIHERIWLNLAGFCLRPGFGDPLDEWRIDQVWPLYQHGPQFSQGNQSWSEWWVFWRRVAGGLDAQQQQKIYQDIAKFINPTVLRNRKLLAELRQKSYEDMLRLIASLEHLPAEKKTEAANWLLKRLAKKSESQTAWWALGRLASRMPFHGSVHNLIPRDKVQEWLQQVLKENWKQNQHAGFAAVMMARKTGDRARDLDNQLITRIVDQLHSTKAPASWIGMLTDVQELNDADTKRVFGEALPLGLKLLG